MDKIIQPLTPSFLFKIPFIQVSGKKEKLVRLVTVKLQFLVWEEI